jgi:hypothetical protein
MEEKTKNQRAMRIEKCAPHPTVSGKANKHKGKSGASPHNLQNLRDTREAKPNLHRKGEPI